VVYAVSLPSSAQWRWCEAALLPFEVTLTRARSQPFSEHSHADARGAATANPEIPPKSAATPRTNNRREECTGSMDRQRSTRLDAELTFPCLASSGYFDEIELR
jgi:hypothetical protein